MKIQIYHNPKCSKSRDSYKLLQESGFNFEIIEYLKNPLTKDELKTILIKLGMKAENLIRKTEAIFKENYRERILSEDEWIDAMILHPKLIERPVIIKENKAVIGRPIEKVIELLKS